MAGQRDNLPDPLDLAKIVAARLVENAQQAFVDKKIGGHEWPARGVPNVAGILSDLENGTNVKERRFTSQDVLVDTGILRASITANVKSPTEMEVGSFVDYAAKHQLGLPSTIQITRTMAINLKEYMRGLQKSKSKAKNDRAKQLGFMFNVVKQPSKTINLPERPFFAWTEKDTKAVKKAVARLIKSRQGGSSQ